MEDPALRGPALRVIAINAIGNRRVSHPQPKRKNKKKSKPKSNEVSYSKGAEVGEGIMRDIIGALQSSGGTATLDRKVMLMRRDILSAMCYMFRHNEDLKSDFRNNGGFIWAISVMNGIGKSLDKDTKGAHGMTTDHNTPEKIREGGSADVIHITTPESGSPATEKKEEHHAGGEEGSKPRSDSRAEEVYKAPKEAFIFLKMLLNTISIVLMGNPVNQEYFRTEIRFAALAEALQSCHFIEGSNAIELCDALLNLAVKGYWPPACPAYRELTNNNTNNNNNNNLNTPRGGGGSGDGLVSPYGNEPERGREERVVVDTAAVHQHVYHCHRCSDELLIENPEIFKIIIQLLDSALGKADDMDVIYILNQLSFLTAILPSNQHKISEADILCDILHHFGPILIKTPDKLAEERLRKRQEDPAYEPRGRHEEANLQEGAAALQTVVLQLIQKIGTHHMSLQALRLYLGLMKDTETFPVSLLVTLVRIARRDGYPIPTYYLDFTARRASVALPVLENKLLWPPANGYSIFFWMCIGERGVSLDTAGSSQKKGPSRPIEIPRVCLAPFPPPYTTKDNH